MKLFQNIKTKKMYYRILALLLAMAAIMFLMAFLFMRTYISQSYESRAKESAQQFLTTAGEYVDLAVLDLGRAMQQLLWNTDVTGAILIPDEVSYNRKVEIVKALATFEQDNPLVERATLLTYVNQTLYDASGNILLMKDAPQRSFLSRFNSGVQAMTVSDDTFFTVVLTAEGDVAVLQDFPTPEENGALLVELREDILLQFLEQTLQETKAYMEILDPAGSLIAAFGSRKGTTSQAEVFIGQSGWTFQMWQQTAQIQMTSTMMLRLIGIWALIFGTVSVAAAILITWSIYRPIHVLRSVVEDEEQESKGENELEMVRRVYETTRQQNTSLSIRVAEMAPIVRDRLYKNLLAGREISEAYLLDRLAYLNSPFSPEGIFTVMTASLRESWDGNPDELMGSLYQQLSEETRDSDTNIYSIREYILMDDYSLVVILSFPEHIAASQIKASRLALKKKIEEFSQRSNASDSLILGWGKQCQGLQNLHYSYKEALADLNYHQYHGNDAQEASSSLGHDCRRILDLAIDGDISAARRALEILIQELHQEYLTPSELEKSYNDIMDHMVESLLELHAPEEKLHLFELYYQQAEQLTDKERDDLVLSIGDQSLALLGYYGQKNRNRYIVKAQKFIQERCVDNHLSLDMVAENVGINPAYLSRLFYELCDINFVNYVNECRVERAKLLLRQSKIPVQEVGFRTGFNSLQNFNRVFKKHIGMTPGAYRKQEFE